MRKFAYQMGVRAALQKRSGYGMVPVDEGNPHLVRPPIVEPGRESPRDRNMDVSGLTPRVRRKGDSSALKFYNPTGIPAHHNIVRDPAIYDTPPNTVFDLSRIGSDEQIRRAGYPVGRSYPAAK